MVRIAPNEISFTEERAWGDICSPSPAARYGMTRDMSITDLMGGELANPDPRLPRVEQKHSLMRRSFAPSLTKRALAAQEPLIVGHVNSMVRHVAGSINEFQDVVTVYTYVSFNIFSDLFLGESLNLFDETRYVPWVRTIPLFTKGTSIATALSRFAITRNVLKIPAYFFGSKLRDKFLDVAYEVVDRRLATQTQRPDMLQFALGSADDGKRKLSPSEIRDFAPILMFASTESTPTTIGGLTFLLLKHPEALDRVIREIRTAFKSNDEITLSGTAALEYTHACIEEALRVYPPAAIGVPRVVPNAGASIAGRWVPGGTIVHQPHGPIFSASENFRDADKFIPERWLASHNAAFSTDKRNAFHPFGTGAQACIGIE